jgi:hypothetical protein
MSDACLLSGLPPGRHPVKLFPVNYRPELKDLNARSRQLLAGIYGWFTKGFDSADLQDDKIDVLYSSRGGSSTYCQP